MNAKHFYRNLLKALRVIIIVMIISLLCGFIDQQQLLLKMYVNFCNSVNKIQLLSIPTVKKYEVVSQSVSESTKKHMYEIEKNKKDSKISKINLMLLHLMF